MTTPRQQHGQAQKPRIVDVSGSNSEIGRQHALATMHLRPAVEAWIAASLERYPETDRSAFGRLDEAAAAWEELTPGTLDQLNAMAEVYNLPARGLLTAVLGSYLDCFAEVQGPPEGCTTLAVSRPRPLLSKNRDNENRFLTMQTVLRAKPVAGNAWLALSTAGAPGVHSSGMNGAGLCVADTHVRSSDVGPGIPRFASMMHLLEQCTTTEEAVDYLLTTSQMGLGTLTLLDATGSMAVVECAFSQSEVLQLTRSQLENGASAMVATNHYVSTSLCEAWLESATGTPGESSRARRSVAVEALAKRHDQGGDPMGADDLKELAGSHMGFDAEGNTLPGSICQHGPRLESETISTAIFDPLAREMRLCLGHPCSGTFERFRVST
jgi:hypothetical protein